MSSSTTTGEINFSIKSKGTVYNANKADVIGRGSFGVVYRARTEGTGEVVAIKKVLQDKRFKNRELQIMRLLNHPNIVALKHSFYTEGEKNSKYLNLVLEYVPQNAYHVTRHYTKHKKTMPLIYVQLYIYQLLRSLGYIHELGICHRDIKPQNLLIDPETAVLKLCDWGSAKLLVKDQPNVSYICSRYYRAPELIFGAVNYTTAIDVWSTGCVMAELLLGTPLFPGESSVDQLVEIIKILGSPTREEIQSMNKSFNDFDFPGVSGVPFEKVFRSAVPESALDLLSQLLQYDPKKRPNPLEACAHPFFDTLRDLNTTLPNGKPLPPLFNFTQVERDAPNNVCKRLMPNKRDSGSSSNGLKTTTTSSTTSSTTSFSSPITTNSSSSPITTNFPSLTSFSSPTTTNSSSSSITSFPSLSVYRKAALAFTGCKFEILHQSADDAQNLEFTDVMSAKDVGLYGCLCALASFSRQQLRRHVIDNFAFREYLELVPTAREMVLSFYNSEYVQCFQHYNTLKQGVLKYDLYLRGVHVQALEKSIRRKSLLQYLSAFVSVDLHGMAKIFQCSVQSLLSELTELIGNTKILTTCRLDAQNYRLYRKLASAPQPNTTTTRLLKKGDQLNHNLKQILISAKVAQNKDNFEREFGNKNSPNQM